MSIDLSSLSAAGVDLNSLSAPTTTSPLSFQNLIPTAGSKRDGSSAETAVDTSSTTTVPVRDAWLTADVAVCIV